MLRRLLFLATSIGLLILTSCSKSEYHKLVEQELASGVRQDSLFLGIYLGMTSKEFYTHCWNLHDQGIIREGIANNSVHYPIDQLKHPAAMDFYPGFANDRIVEMPVLITYDSWAPWNKDLQAPRLLEDVKAMLDSWYGPGYVEIENPGSYDVIGNAFVKVNGNRRISAYIMDDSRVRVDFVDLLAKQELEHAD